MHTGLETLLQDTPKMGAVDTPMKVLADWYLIDCEGRNLQPRTLEFYRCRIDYLLQNVGDVPPSAVSTAYLRALLMDLRQKRSWSVQNTNHCIQVWTGLFRYLEREGLAENDPTRRLQKLRQERCFPKPFSIEQIRSLLRVMQNDFCGIRDAVMTLVLLDTGIRYGELMGLHVADVDLAQGHLRVFGKGRKERFVPFQATVRKMLLRYLAVRSAVVGRDQETALWLTIGGTPLSWTQFRKRLQEYGAKAGVDGIHPHRFRHTFATEYLRNDGNPQMLQQILGHTTPLMVQRYVHISDRDAMENHRTASPVEKWKVGAVSGRKR